MDRITDLDQLNYHILDGRLRTDAEAVLPDGVLTQSFLRQFSSSGVIGEPTKSTESRIFALGVTNRNFIYLNGDPDYIPGDAIRYKFAASTVWSTETALSRIIKIALPVGTSTLYMQKKDRNTGLFPVEYREFTVTVNLSINIPARIHEIIRLFNEFLAPGRLYGNPELRPMNMSEWATVFNASTVFPRGASIAGLVIPDTYSMIDRFRISWANFSENEWSDL